MKNALSKKTKGEIAELFVSAFLKESGFNILFPFGENSRYDIVIEKNGKFQRVQIKYSVIKNGTIRVNCASSNNWSVKPYKKNEIDLIAIYNPDYKKVYFVPINKINTSSIILRLNKTKNKQQKSIRFAQDYTKLPK